MKNARCLSILIATVLALSAAASYANTQSYIIDFNDVPDGTPLSQFSSFSGVLCLAGQETETWLDPSTRASESRTVESGVFSGGQLQTTITFDPTLYPGLGPFDVDYITSLTGLFVSPVISLSFESSGPPYHWYQYTGIDQNGVPFTNHGTVFWDWEDFPNTPSMGKTVISAPDGGYLTGFEVWNGDEYPSAATVGLENIAITAVPESSNTAALLAVTVLGFAVIRRSRRLAQKSASSSGR